MAMCMLLQTKLPPMLCNIELQMATCVALFLAVLYMFNLFLLVFELGVETGQRHQHCQLEKLVDACSGEQT